MLQEYEVMIISIEGHFPRRQKALWRRRFKLLNGRHNSLTSSPINVAEVIACTICLSDGRENGREGEERTGKIVDIWRPTTSLF